MADIKKLSEERAALLTQASALVSETAERGESLTGEAQERFEKLTTNAANLADAIANGPVSFTTSRVSDRFGIRTAKLSKLPPSPKSQLNDLFCGRFKVNRPGQNSSVNLFTSADKP
jgi:hypothetical protein